MSLQSVPDLPVPAGAEVFSSWADGRDRYRLLVGPTTQVEPMRPGPFWRSGRFFITPYAVQLPDGSIDADGQVAGPPVIQISEECDDGKTYDRLTISASRGRQLAVEIFRAVEEIGCWEGGTGSI